jgi:RNA polymerase sigma factor (sigma-70 family)
MSLAVETPSDDALWARAAAGEPDAFGVLYERHARSIYNYLFRRCADWAVAEDLTSVVFLEAYRRRTTVEMREGKVRPWLFGVATNVLRNQRRSLRRHAAALRRLPPSQNEANPAEDAAARLDAQREMRSTLAALRRLSRRDLDVLALCVWSELSYEDAAVALGVPVGTVRSRLSRARARLAELASAHGHEVDVTHESEGALRP